MPGDPNVEEPVVYEEHSEISGCVARRPFDDGIGDERGVLRTGDVSKLLVRC